jgi:ribosomal protein L7/L12
MKKLIDVLFDQVDEIKKLKTEKNNLQREVASLQYQVSNTPVKREYAELKDIEMILDFMLKQCETPTVEGKINSIKGVRAITSEGLKESKDFVDKWQSKFENTKNRS